MVKIKKNLCSSLDTAKINTEYAEFKQYNFEHRENVRKIMFELAMRILEVGAKHDWTRKSKEDLFYSDFITSLSDGSCIEDKKWFKYHVENERHHLNSKCPGDVNLIDVIEMIVDSVCKDFEKSGSATDVEISDEVLKKALYNTKRYIESFIDIE